MADIAKIRLGNQEGAYTEYDIKDATARQAIVDLDERVDEIEEGTYTKTEVDNKISGLIYDVSALHPTSGVSGGSTYASLSAALAVIPRDKRKGGMTVKFVLSSDNRYVQYRYMGTATTGNPNPFLNTDNWQGVDDTPKVESQNLVTSGGVEEALRQIDKINITAATAGVTPFVFKTGVTYHVKNNLNSQVTISHRNTPDGTSEDIVAINAKTEIDYTPTTDGLYLRYGAACNIDIWVKAGLYGQMLQGDAQLAENINNVDKKQNLHSSIARYAIQAEGFEDGRYWYDNNGVITAVTNSNTFSGVIDKIPVSEGDEIRFNVSGGGYLLIVTDSEDNVIISYNNTNIDSLGGKCNIPVNGAYLYVNTAKTAKETSWCFVNTQIIPAVEKRLDNTEACLMLTYVPTIQNDKYYDASGTLQSRSGLQAFEISDIDGIYKIKCNVGVSSYAYYGFVVNNTFVAKRWIASEHGGENSGTIVLDVPVGATKFRCSWSTTIVTEQKVGLLKVSYIDEKIGAIKEDVDKASKIVDAADVLYNLKGNWVVGRYSMTTGELDSSNNSFKAVEISLDDFFVKTVTFKKTYTGDSNYACYGFIVNNVWIGYQGMTPSTATPTEVTIEVPRGATVFKCCWNGNQATEDELVVKAVGYKFSNEPKPNQPVYQFEPDFILTRVPQMTCPTEATLSAMTLTELYAKYDALVTAYPDYITKVDCDIEVQTALSIEAPTYMEGLPIYMYKFLPKMGGDNSGVDFTEKPKILITSMHPQERLGVLATFEMIKMVCEGWTNDVNAEQLRSYADIYILPCPWPWNFVNNSRTNYNGINGNRQFPTKHWAQSGQLNPPDGNWSGTEPLSEYEAKVVNYYLSLIKPDVCLDVHTSGNDNQGHMGIFLVNKDDQPLINLCGIIARSTSNRAIQDNQNFPSNPNECIYGVYPENAESKGEFYEYAYEQGCKYSILSEESPYSKWDEGVFGGTSGPIIEQYTDGILREQVQYIFNTVLRLTKAACIQYYKE